MRRTFDQYERFLCHYTGRYPALAHILPGRALRLAPFGLMRDPRESRDQYIGIGLPGLWLPWPTGYDDLSQELNAGVNAVLKREFKLLSLTADDAPLDESGRFPMGKGHFGRCYARPRMWEQYAEHHRGICLLFSYERLIEVTTSELNAQDWFRHGLVRYHPMSEGITTDPTISWNEASGGALVDVIERLIASRAPDTFFDKFDDYASEQEYRFVIRSDADEFVTVPFRDALRAIVIGELFPGAELTPLFRLAAELGAALLRMEWRQGLGQIAGFYNPTIPIEHNHAREIEDLREELAPWHPTLKEYEAGS